MDGYKHTFEVAVQAASKFNHWELVHNIFPKFRENEGLFHFIMACGAHRHRCDTEAIFLSLSIDPTITKFLVGVGPSRAGGGLPKLDVVESRHILLLTWILTRLSKDWSGKKIVEFGGGYGNFARLAQHYLGTDVGWNIVDLRHISELQKWFLCQENISTSNMNFVSTENYKAIDDVWLTIGTHSLSEFDIETFRFYFDTTVKNSTYLFYASSNIRPSRDILQRQFEIIEECFSLVAKESYENGESTMYLFRNYSDDGISDS